MSQNGFEQETLDPRSKSGRTGFQHPCPENYELLALKGKGGMGTVYEAYDQRLQRHVAIKFLVGDNYEQTERFMREALALARVEHENLCRIYETGEVDGHPFIVMQLICGRVLSEAVEEMGLNEKLLVIKSVAEAIHQSHRAGLIHRDIKPGNIMVECTPSGYKAYVLDFGLARRADERDLTLTGDVLGTPGFMAPEQAKGELEKLNQLTDVYGLGATLYYLIGGQAPYTGESGSAVLLALLEKEPESLDKLHSKLPRDVKTMVMKCLARNQAERYPSANELAQDIGRYLNGEPIRARPPGFGYLLVKKTVKHKVLVSVCAVALVLLSLSVVWGGWRAAIRADLMQQFTEQVKEIEARARYTYLSPRHDIRPDLDQLQARMTSIQELMAESGKWARGPGNFALGSGYLALGQEQTAREYLELARATGWKNQELMVALGTCYSILYREKLAAAQMRNARGSSGLLEKEAQSLREKALNYMDRVPADTITTASYFKALLAYCGGNYKETLTLLDGTEQKTPWFYETHKLRADAMRGQAMEAYHGGQSETARSHFGEALVAYEKAIGIAPSDPANYTAAATAILGMMELEVYEQKDLEPYLEKGLGLLEEGLAVLPEDGKSYLVEARIRRRLAHQLRIKRGDPREQLKAALEAVEKARSFGGDETELLRMEGSLYWHQARDLNRRRLDSEEKTEKAIATLAKVAEELRDYPSCFYLGSAYQSHAKRQARLGGDAGPSYKKAVEVLRQAVHLKPDRIEAYNSLAQNLYHLARFDQQMAVAHMEEAVAMLEKAVELNPKHVVLRYQLGRILLTLAQEGRPDSGRLNEADCRRALVQLEAGLKLNPELIYLYDKMSWAYLLQARYAWHHGVSPEPYLDKAIDICREGEKRRPGAISLRQHLASTYYFRGKFRVREGKDPGTDLDRAISISQEIINESERIDAFVISGSANRLRAEYAILCEKDPQPFLALAEKAFERILSINPNHAEAERSMGRLFTLKARWREARGAGSAASLQRAREALDRALSQTPNSPYCLIADARWYLVNPAAQIPKTLIHALEKQADSAEAQAARACLLKRVATTPKEREKAHALLEQAFADNGFLVSQWRNLAGQ